MKIRSLSALRQPGRNIAGKIPMRIYLTFVCVAVFSLISFVPLPAQAQGSFLPSWKLMNSLEKQHFIAGYVQGWKDAQQVTDITISYVKQNPAQAVAGLEKMRSLYDLSGAKPELLAKAIDVFYMAPENSSASLSSAVTAARNALNSAQ